MSLCQKSDLFTLSKVLLTLDGVIKYEAIPNFTLSKVSKSISLIILSLGHSLTD
jgi:hypothetical protein